jgi:hypothetical protein
MDFRCDVVPVEAGDAMLIFASRKCKTSAAKKMWELANLQHTGFDYIEMSDPGIGGTLA